MLLLKIQHYRKTLIGQLKYNPNQKCALGIKNNFVQVFLMLASNKIKSHNFINKLIVIILFVGAILIQKHSSL